MPGAARNDTSRSLSATGGKDMRLGRLMKTLIVMMAVLSVLSGCRSMTGKSAGTNIDDASITAAVKSKLVAEKASNLTRVHVDRSEEHTSELQSRFGISYAVFCLNK